MKINLNRSPIKVLWIDTSRIWNLDTEVWKKIAKLVVEQKIVLVDSGQFAEMIGRYSNGSIPLNEKSKTILEIYRTLVDGSTALDHVTFQSRQNNIAMEAFVKGATVEYNFSDLFDDLLQNLAPMFDQFNKNAVNKVGTPRTFKTLSSDIVNDWKILRKEARAKKQTLKERQKEEILGMHGAILSAMEGTNTTRKKNLVDHYLRKWKRVSGNSDPYKMLGFFKSEYYKSIPYVNIYSWIISDLITGEEELRDSDYFDAIMIPMMLPFADFMLVDSSMRNRIINKLKLVKPQGTYDCKLLTLVELEKELNDYVSS